MHKQKTLAELYLECKIQGQFKDQEIIDTDKIKTMIHLSNACTSSAEKLMKTLNKNNAEWSIVYTLIYDALRQICEALIIFDKKKIANHQCLFAYLCTNHPELEFDWNFFEKIRTKRNGIQYYGILITYNDFKEIELQMKIYIKTLQTIIEQKLTLIP